MSCVEGKENPFNKLKKLECYWGIIQEEMAHLIGYDATSYSKLITGHETIKQKTFLKKVSRLLDLDTICSQTNNVENCKEVLKKIKKYKTNLILDAFKDHISSEEFALLLKTPLGENILWVKPLPKNPDYHTPSKTQILDQIKENLLSGVPGAVICIYGPGGVGKTDMAVSVVQHFKKNKQFDNIIYFSTVDQIESCENKSANFLSNLHEEILNDIYFPNKAQGNSSIDKLWSLLSRNSLLLIIDRIEVIKDDGFLSFLHAISGKCKILVTSRIPFSRFKNYRIPPFSNEESLRLIDTLSISNPKEFNDIFKSKIISFSENYPGLIKEFLDFYIDKNESHKNVEFYTKSDSYKNYLVQMYDYQFNELSHASRKFLFALVKSPSFVWPRLINIDQFDELTANTSSILNELENYSFLEILRNEEKILGLNISVHLTGYLNNLKRPGDDNFLKSVKVEIGKSLVEEMRRYLLSLSADTLRGWRECIVKNKQIIEWAKTDTFENDCIKYFKEALNCHPKFENTIFKKNIESQIKDSLWIMEQLGVPQKQEINIESPIDWESMLRTINIATMKHPNHPNDVNSSPLVRKGLLGQIDIATMKHPGDVSSSPRDGETGQKNLTPSSILDQSFFLKFFRSIK